MAICLNHLSDVRLCTDQMIRLNCPNYYHLYLLILDEKKTFLFTELRSRNNFCNMLRMDVNGFPFLKDTSNRVSHCKRECVCVSGCLLYINIFCFGNDIPVVVNNQYSHQKFIQSEYVSGRWGLNPTWYKKHFCM